MHQGSEGCYVPLLIYISYIMIHNLHNPNSASCFICILSYLLHLDIVKPCSLAFLGVLQIVHPWSLQDFCCILEVRTCSAKLESKPATAACHPGWNRRMSLSKSLFKRRNHERCPTKKRNFRKPTLNKQDNRKTALFRRKYSRFWWVLIWYTIVPCLSCPLFHPPHDMIGCKRRYPTPKGCKKKDTQCKNTLNVDIGKNDLNMLIMILYVVKYQKCTLTCDIIHVV